jgi:hypothetical protein
MRRVLIGAGLAGLVLTGLSLAPDTVEKVAGTPIAVHWVPNVRPMVPDPAAPTTTVPPVTTTTTVALPPPAPPTTTSRVVVPAPQPPRPQISEWQQVFNEMAASLPGTYYAMDLGAWGKANLNTGEVYIAPRTPLVNLRSVMWHEAAHVMQGALYGGRAGADAALAPYGGIEVVADCMALEMGASWINYGCTDAGKQGAAEVFGNS